MFAISKRPLFWRNTCEALDFAQCSAHQRKEHKVEQTLTRLQKLLELAPHVNESTPEIVEVRVGQSAWERGQLETFARDTDHLYQQAIQEAVTTLRTLRDSVELLPEASWLHTGMEECSNVGEEMLHLNADCFPDAWSYGSEPRHVE